MVGFDPVIPDPAGLSGLGKVAIAQAHASLRSGFCAGCSWTGVEMRAGGGVGGIDTIPDPVGREAGSRGVHTHGQREAGRCHRLTAPSRRARRPAVDVAREGQNVDIGGPDRAARWQAVIATKILQSSACLRPGASVYKAGVIAKLVQARLEKRNIAPQEHVVIIRLNRWNQRWLPPDFLKADLETGAEKDIPNGFGDRFAGPTAIGHNITENEHLHASGQHPDRSDHNPTGFESLRMPGQNGARAGHQGRALPKMQIRRHQRRLLPVHQHLLPVRVGHGRKEHPCNVDIAGFGKGVEQSDQPKPRGRNYGAGKGACAIGHVGPIHA